MIKYPDVKILIVDDQKLCLKISKSFITESKLFNPENIITLNNPLDVIRFLKNKYADILITDYSMPKMNGDILIEVARILCPFMKIILFTSLEIKSNPNCRPDIEKLPDIFLEKISPSEQNEFVNILEGLCKHMAEKKWINLPH